MSTTPPGDETHSLRPASDPREVARRHAESRRPKENLPERIGRYRILEVLGEGGMGVVYLAEQDKPFHARVALKIIKLGMDTKATLARFEAEREALALMNHSNVAKVLDAGATEQGRPYFVMEHVPGIHITEYCDKHRLTTEERLGLFVQVCHAVQHAHQKGIIHRDIKPSNVLVMVQDDKPVPKVIDFGVAKATQKKLTEKTLFTEQGQLIGTPGYMSPEQAEMTALDVDTRTDIYSLGVLLYELLVGAPPFDAVTLLKAGFAEIQRIIREVEPPKPSTRLSSLGAVSTTVAQKRKTETRTLVRQVRGDLDWIVMKCLEKDRTRRYDTASGLAQDLERYLRREPVLAGPPGLSYLLAKFIQRRWRSLGAAAVFVVLVGVALFMFAQSRWSAAEAYRQRVMSLYYEAMLDAYSRPNDAINKFAEVSLLDPDFLEARIRRAYLLHRENRWQDAAAEAEGLLADHPQTGPAHLLLAKIYETRDLERSRRHRDLGRQLLPNDRFYTALAMGEDENEAAIDLLNAVLQEEGTNYEARFDRAWRYNRLANYESMLADGNILTEMQPTSAAAWYTVAIAQSRLREYESALDAFDRAIELSPASVGAFLHRSELRIRMGRRAQALADCEKALAIDPEYEPALAHRALLMHLSGQTAEAESACREILAADPQNAFAWHRLGNTLASQEKFDEALTAFDRALELRPIMGDAWADRAFVAYRLERYDDAFASLSESIRLDPRNEVALNRRALLRHYLGQLTEAEQDLTTAIELNSDYADAYHNRARVRRALGLLEAAMRDHDRAIAASRSPDAIAARGITRRCLGDEAGALVDFKAAVELSSGSSTEAHLLVWETMMLQNTPAHREDAARHLEAAKSAATTEWEKALVTTMEGRADFQVLLAMAKRPEQRCQALYALGSRSLVGGDLETARRYFAECLATGAVDAGAFDLAKLHLESINP